MKSRLLPLVLLLGWGVSVAGLVMLVQRAGVRERPFQVALSEGGDLEALVGEDPLTARRVVEGLWKGGLAVRAQGEDATDEFDRARRLALAIQDRLEDPSLARFTEWYRQRGTSGATQVLQVEGSLQDAEASYKNDALVAAGDKARKALNDSRILGDRWSELRTLHLLGDTAWMGGDPEEASERYQELLKLAAEQGSREKEAAAVNNLAALDEDAGRLREAANGYRRALELGRGHGLPVVEAFALLYLGHLFHQLGLYERSVGYFQQAEEVFHALDETELEATAGSNRGASLQRLEKTKEALAAYRRSLELRSREGDRLGQQRTLLHIAELLVESGDSEEALSVLGEVLASTRGATDKESLHFRWGALLTAGDLDLAEGRLVEATRAYQEAGELVNQVGSELDRAETSRRRARLVLAEGNTEGAIQELEAAVEVIESLRESSESEVERVRLLETRRSIYEDLAGIHLRQLDDPTAGFELLERSRSRALLDSFEGGAVLSAGEGGEVDVALPAAAEPAPLSRVAAAIEPGTILIHYTVTADWLAVLAIDAQGVRARSVRAMEEKDLNRLVRIFGGDATASFPLREGWTTLYSDAQRNLSLMLLEPVKHLLSDARTVLIVPDDILFAIPWGALRWGDWTHYLSETHEVVLEPSASAFVRLYERSSGTVRDRALVVANPRAPGAARALPEAEIEAKELAGLLPGSRVLLGEEASEPAVRREMGRFPIIHFATHARVDPERPLQSSLLLAGERGALEESLLAPLAPEDGVLTGFEALELPLRSGALVTLAGCETVGVTPRRGEGVVGLARAFIESGASTVVATLWPVEDRATRELMTRFYRAMASGSSAARALSQAQAAMAQGDAGESRRYPYYWAGFVLIGDGR